MRETSSSRPTTFGGRTFDVSVATLVDGRRLVALRERQQDANLSTLAVGAERFENFKRGQRRVRLLGLSTLGLLTLLLLFAATWAAIHLARGIGTPIRAPAEAAREVARAVASEGNGNAHAVGNSNVDGNANSAVGGTNGGENSANGVERSTNAGAGANGGFNGNNGGGVIPVALTATALAPRTDATRRG